MSRGFLFLFSFYIGIIINVLIYVLSKLPGGY